MDLAPRDLLGQGGVRILAWAVDIGRCLDPSALPVNMEAAPPTKDSPLRVASSSKASHDTSFPPTYISR